MTTQEIKANIAKQRETNIALYKSITMASHDDPLNKKAEPILQQWREGSKKIKEMITLLNELEAQERGKADSTYKESKIFINGFGEATTRNITCAGYERMQKQNQKAILSFIGG